jgi:hypothetical protein
LSICFSLTGCPRIFERRQIICCLPCWGGASLNFNMQGL